MAHATAQLFGSPPLGPLGGAKGQISLNLNYKVNFKGLFVSDIKHIRLDFHWTAWVMPHGWDLGESWGLGGSIFFL